MDLAQWEGWRTTLGPFESFSRLAYRYKDWDGACLFRQLEARQVLRCERKHQAKRELWGRVRGSSIPASFGLREWPLNSRELA